MKTHVWCLLTSNVWFLDLCLLRFFGSAAEHTHNGRRKRIFADIKQFCKYIGEIGHTKQKVHVENYSWYCPGILYNIARLEIFLEKIFVAQISTAFGFFVCVFGSCVLACRYPDVIFVSSANFANPKTEYGYILCTKKLSGASGLWC